MNRKYLMFPILYMGALHADLGPIRFSGLTNDIIDTATISAPGNYRLARSLAVSSGVAITITTSNVELDLDNFEIVGAGAGTTGILINSSENITVKNGTIDSFDTGISVQDNTTRINLLNLDVVHCGPTTAITFNGPFFGEPTISEVLVKNVNLLQCTLVGFATLLNLMGCKDAVISQCTLNENINFTSGIDLFNCRKCSINDTQINNNSALQLAGIQLSITTSECIIENCKIMHNQAAGAFNGMLIDEFSPSNYFNNCLIADNNSLTSLVNGYVTFSHHNLFQNCESSHNTAFSVCRGFMTAASGFTGDNITFIECIARNNTSLNDIATGFDIGVDLLSSSSCHLIRCLSFDNIGSGQSIGFRINTTTGAGNEVKECQALGNDFGFRRINTAANDAFFKNISTQNRVSQYDAGFPAGSFQLAANLAAINASLTVRWTNVGIGT